MISVLVGLPGEGKSLTASMEIRYFLNKGHTIYTNLHLDESRPNYHYFHTQDWKVILRAQDGIVYFDEGQFILDARNWQELPVEFRQQLQKGRHEGLDFVVLTQHIMQIDVAYRRLLYQSRKVIRVFSFRRWSIGFFLVFPVDVMGDDVKISGWPDPCFPIKADWEYYNSYALRSHLPPLEKKDCPCGTPHRID